MQVRYRYRIYPSPGQQQALARAFGCARVVYNDCLVLRDACHGAGEKISDTEVQRRVITLAKLTPERAWLGQVASVALVQACQDARRAYKNWFDSLKGRRKGPKVRHPKPKRKHGRQSIRLTRNGFALHRERLYKVRDARLDHAHKTALRLVRDNQAVYAEDLCVSGLARTRLAKSVADAGWSQLIRCIQEKAARYGRTFAKVGDIRVQWSRGLPSEPSSVTVIREPDGRYYASFVVERAATPLPACDRETGIDLGLNSLVVTSDGEVISNPRFYRAAQRRLRRAQRVLSRRRKGSANRA